MLLFGRFQMLNPGIVRVHASDCDTSISSVLHNTVLLFMTTDFLCVLVINEGADVTYVNKNPSIFVQTSFHLDESPFLQLATAHKSGDRRPRLDHPFVLSLWGQHPHWQCLMTPQRSAFSRHPINKAGWLQIPLPTRNPPHCLAQMIQPPVFSKPPKAIVRTSLDYLQKYLHPSVKVVTVSKCNEFVSTLSGSAALGGTRERLLLSSAAPGSSIS